MNHRNHLSSPQFPATWASAWGEDRFGLWMTLNHKSAELTFRWIPLGSFIIGSQEDEEGRYDDEDQHEVTLKQGFWLADTPVTQAFWEAVTGDNVSHFNDDDLPVEYVSWNDTQSFIETVNNLYPYLSMALPYEAEWEYACRAGTETAFNFGGEVDPTKFNYLSKNSPDETTVIKSYPPNDWGLFDMHGNVWEWCQDEWQKHLGKSPIVIDTVKTPKVSETGESQSGEARLRVARGGSWNGFGRYCRSACRTWHSPGSRDYDLGFRLVFRPRKIGEATGSANRLAD